MKNTIKLRAKLSKGAAVLRILIKHPMKVETIDKKTGKRIPAHFIEKLTITRNGNSLINANWGQAVSKNPFHSFTFNDSKKGDKLSISWSDNKGKSDSKEITL